MRRIESNDRGSALAAARSVRSLLAVCLIFAACSGAHTPSAEPAGRSAPQRDSPDEINERKVRLAVGFTDDFKVFLHDDLADALRAAGAPTEFASIDYQRSDLTGGSFGGRLSQDEPIQHRPIVLIHGNSDRAFGGILGGWQATITDLIQNRGYGPGEIYATTWGPADPTLASLQYHSRDNLTRVRGFLLAVLAYTGAEQIDVISHSMGVTLARKAILGGSPADALAGGAYDLGPPLTDRVRTFIGIAGGNLGLASCVLVPLTPTCAPTNGFYPGILTPVGVADRSAFLQQLLDSPPHFEGSHVISIWSPIDEVVGGACLVYFANTCQIPAQDDEVVLGWLGHLGLKDRTADVLARLLE
jgi:hypothetical protein